MLTPTPPLLPATDRRLRPRLALLGACLVGLFAVTQAGCSGESSDRPEVEAKPAADARPTLARVTAERADLLFRYADDEGFQTVTTIDEVPAAKRGAVQVVDLSQTPEQRQSTRFVQVFDLRAAASDGTFAGEVVPRDRLESMLAEAQATPAQAPIVMYSASWCGVCTKARGFLQKNGVIFTEKDIEKDKGAARELAAKAAKAGVQTNGVPVFDVGGQLMQGFDGDRILKLARGG